MDWTTKLALEGLTAYTAGTVAGAVLEGPVQFTSERFSYERAEVLE